MEGSRSISNTDANQQHGSLLSIWNAIVPKISLARRIVFSAISDILEGQKVEVNEKRKKSLRRLHWKNTEKSIWTLSTIESITDSPRNIYINPSVMKEILALDKELSSVLNDLNLTHNERSRQLLQRLASCSNGKLAVVSSKRGQALCIRSSDSTSSAATKEEAAKFFGDRQSSSSISLYSTDSVVSRRSEGHDKKENPIVRCQKNLESKPLSKNLVHVFRHDSSCQLPPPLCPDDCCVDNPQLRDRNRCDMERRKSSESRDCSRSRRKEEMKERNREEKGKDKMKQQREKDRVKNERKEKVKYRKERERRQKEREKQRKERERERRKLEREIRERELEEEREIMEREREEENYRRKIQREAGRDRRERERDEEKERKDKEREEDKERKEREREERKKRKEKEREEKKENKERGREEAKHIKWSRCYECDYEESTEQQEKSEKEMKELDSEESEVGCESCDKDESKSIQNTRKTGIQCEIPCMCPRCVTSCKSTQATNPKISTSPDYQDSTHKSSPRHRSRLSKFMSRFPNGGLQLRLVPPEKTCRSTKSCTIPKEHSARTIDHSHAPPRMKCSRTVESHRTQLSDYCRPSPQVKSIEPPQIQPTEMPPIKATPCVPQSCERPTRCQRPCKLPRCTRASRFPRLTPRVTPPCRLKQSRGLKPCPPTTPHKPRISTPSTLSVTKPCEPRHHTAPPCSLRLSSPYFHPKSKTDSTRSSVCSEPQLCDTTLCTPPQPSAISPSNSRSGLPTPHLSEHCTPRSDDTFVPYTPPPRLSRPSTPIRVPLPDNFEASKPTESHNNSCGFAPSPQIACASKPCSCSSCACSPCSTGPYSFCDFGPHTPTESPPFNPQHRINQACGPGSTPSLNPQLFDPNPCLPSTTRNPCPPKPCISRSQVDEPCGRSSTCSTSCRPQPYSCDSQCNIKKWACCTKSMRHSRPCIQQRSCSICGLPSYPKTYTPRQFGNGWKTCRRWGNPCSPNCLDSDICHPSSSCCSRRCSPFTLCSGQDICYLRRKHNRPWWSPKRSSCYSSGGCSHCRQRGDLEKYWNPYFSTEEFCYPTGYPCSPWWGYHPMDGPGCSMDSLCHRPAYHFPCPPKECMSIPCAAAPREPASCSPPRKSLSCTPASCQRPPPCPPPPCSHSCMPRAAYCRSLYPPPCQPCPPQYPLHLCPPPCFSQTCPPCPSCSSRISMSSRFPEAGSRKAPTSATRLRNQGVGSPCRPVPHRRPGFFKSPSCLKKFPKCSGKHRAKNLRFPKSGDAKTFFSLNTPRSFSPSGSPTSSCNNIRYPTTSRWSRGSNFWPHPCSSLAYQPYDDCSNQFQSYGGNTSCYPSQTCSAPGVASLFPKMSLSKLKCRKLYRKPCDEHGYPENNNARSSSLSSNSSCSSSRSSLSSSETTYSSRSSSSSSSTSRTSPSYCIASCRNSSSNLFNCKSRLSNSSICSLSECSPRRTICDAIGRCHSNRQTCGSLLDCNSPPPSLRENQQAPISSPPTTDVPPVHCTRSQVCSSANELQHESKLKRKGVDHYDERIRFELQKIGMNQLIKASKPAKCCKKTVLNQSSREELPYAASLASLPLDRADIRVIRQSVRMASKKTDYTSLENRTKLVYYVNLVLDDFETGKPRVQSEYEVRHFYITLDDAEIVQYSLEKSYTKASMFKLFQILNWHDKSLLEALEIGSSPQKVDFSASLDWKKGITSTEIEDTLLAVPSQKISGDLENIVFSDLLLDNQSGVRDFMAGNALDETLINEFKYKKARKNNHKIIFGIYYVIGDMIGGVLSIDAEELAHFLFDIEGGYVLSSIKKNWVDHYFEEGRELVSVKCQCRMRGKKQTDRLSSSTPAAKCVHQKLNDSVFRSPSSKQPAKRKKMERCAKKGSKKSENVAETYRQNEHGKPTTSLRNQQPRQSKVPRTVIPCYESNSHVDSLESLLDGYLQHRPRQTKGEDMELSSHSNTRLQEENVTSNRLDHPIQEIEESSTTTTTTTSESSNGTASTEIIQNATEDAFMCNIPNAPPFILKMNKASPDPAVSKPHPEQKGKSEILSSSLSSTSTDESFDVENISSSYSSLLEKKGSIYTEIPDQDDNCPGIEEFENFVARSITWIKTEGGKRSQKPFGPFMSMPTICMAGLTGTSKNPFSLDEIDSRRPGKHNRSFPNEDELYKKNSNHIHSKIPRMLHPGKCKVHSKMKNVQMTPGSKGCAANKASTCSGPCPAEKKEIQINPFVKVSVSTTCPSLTNTSAFGNVIAGGKQDNKNKNANIQASQPSMGDCMKGIKSDPGCYCGNTSVEPTLCPIRLREECECVEEEAAAAETAEPQEEALCYCPPGEQPLLMKKSNIECDCANRRRCEDDTLVEPPKEKPEVFWALTKVSLSKDGTKNFEIIDVSPVTPGYYLMPDVNNLVLVGPQPKPAKATPSKNCSCK